MPTIVLQNVTGHVLVRLRWLAQHHHRSVSDAFRAVAIAEVRRLPAPRCRRDRAGYHGRSPGRSSA